MSLWNEFVRSWLALVLGGVSMRADAGRAVLELSCNVGSSRLWGLSCLSDFCLKCWNWAKEEKWSHWTQKLLAEEKDKGFIKAAKAEWVHSGFWTIFHFHKQGEALVWCFSLLITVLAMLEPLINGPCSSSSFLCVQHVRSLFGDSNAFQEMYFYGGGAVWRIFMVPSPGTSMVGAISFCWRKGAEVEVKTEVLRKNIVIKASWGGKCLNQLVLIILLKSNAVI